MAKKPMFRRAHTCPECGCRWSEGYRTEHRLRRVRGSVKVLAHGDLRAWRLGDEEENDE